MSKLYDQVKIKPTESEENTVTTYDSTAYDPLKNCQIRKRKTVLEGPENWHVIGCFFRFCSRLQQSSFYHGKNETVLILLSPILSSF